MGLAAVTKDKPPKASKLWTDFSHLNRTYHAFRAEVYPIPIIVSNQGQRQIRGLEGMVALAKSHVLWPFTRAVVATLDPRAILWYATLVGTGRLTISLFKSHSTFNT